MLTLTWTVECVDLHVEYNDYLFHKVEGVTEFVDRIMYCGIDFDFLLKMV
jgi:hypothetical protein